MTTANCPTPGACRAVLAAGAFFSVLVFGGSAGSAWGGDGASPVTVAVLEDTPQHVVLDFSFGGFTRTPVLIEGIEYTRVSLAGESQILDAGAPDLPQVCRSVIIPDAAAVEVRVSGGEYYEIEGMRVAPSKGNLSREIDPETVPYTFGAVYKLDADYPGVLAELGEPYVLRDHRGVAVRVRPFQYNPVAQRLRVYTQMTVEVANVGPSAVNVPDRSAGPKELSLAFHQLYRHHFVNYGSRVRYNPLDESGEMLIICYDAWMPNVQPLVDHKNSIGIVTTMVGVSTIGNNSTLIRNYIQNVYNSTNLAFVLLVGDAAQVASPYAAGGSSDPTYALLAGGDNYPDAMVGRFSAETAAQVDTQVQRTIEYELLPATTQDWFWRGMGIASTEGAGIGDEGQADNVHMAQIRTWLLGAGYTLVDELYGSGATAAQVSSGVNNGRGIINYCGHGSSTSWVTTGFSISHVNALTNVGRLPFIFSVACVNGQFSGGTCFAEAWLRATSGGQPTGAVAMYASSINQSWAPPMEAQDEFNLLLTQLEPNTYFSYGALCYAGSCSMIDHYGGDGVSMFLTWHIFGDPSVRIVGVAEPPTGLWVRGEDLEAAGQKGGPFTPDSTAYVVENKNETPLDYAVSATVDWVDISNGAGTLPPLGSVEVTVSLNERAERLNHGLHEGVIYFVNLTDHDGDTERPVSIAVDDMRMRYSFPLDGDPGWSTTGAWAYGQPTGGGSHAHDPLAGHTGVNVYGYNLAGDYTNNMPARYLTTTAIDCSRYTLTQLRFWRWLGVEGNLFDDATVEVSNDGVNWVEVWHNPGTAVSDTAWQPMALDISAVADNQPTVYVRWAMGPTDGGVTYPGWNIDDVEIWGVQNEEPVPGDLDGDGDVDLADLAILLAHYGMSGAGYEDGDLDGDGDVDLADLSTLLANYGIGG